MNQFTLSAQAITELADKIIAEWKSTQDAIAAVTDNTYANTLLAYANGENKFNNTSPMCTFPMEVSTDKEIREASSAASKKLEAFGIESNAREDVYNALVRYQKSLTSGEKLEPETERYLNKVLETFERAGLKLSAEAREELKKLRQQESELCIDFQNNIAADNTTLEFTADELTGVSTDVMKRLTTRDNKYIITLKISEVLPVLTNCKIEDTRRAVETAYNSKCISSNVSLLEKIVELRAAAAKILGYNSHADHNLKTTMAASAENVLDFLNELQERLKPLASAETKKLLELKRTDKEALGESFDNTLNSWDVRYYNNVLLESEYSVDNNLIKEYFPMEHVISRLFDIYQKIFRLTFKEIDNANTWYSDVKMFAVWDKDTGDLIGTFYMDLYPREGKFTHAAEFTLSKCFTRSDGKRELPMAALVTNFTKPTSELPSLLLHSEVKTLFHEFGHVIHELCARTKFSRFSGTSVERDFVEAPSQMLENWCWDKETLQTISKHYLTGESLPSETIDKMIAAKNVCSGLLNLRQIFLGIFDQTIHSRDSVNVVELWPQLYESITTIPCTPGTCQAASFGHMVGGYDAKYYGYLYSEVFSADMFSKFKHVGLRNSTWGRFYREIVLAPGGTRDSIDSVCEFLGREVRQDAFLESLGLTN